MSFRCELGFHKWGKWTAQEVETVRKHITLGEMKHIALQQDRTCKRCGKQERTFSK